MIDRAAVVPKNFCTRSVSASAYEFIKCIFDCVPDILFEFAKRLLASEGNIAEIRHMRPHKIANDPLHSVIFKTVRIICGKPLDMIIKMQGIDRTIEPTIKFLEIPEQLAPAPFKYPIAFSKDPFAGVPEHSLCLEVPHRPVVLSVPRDKRTNYHVGVEKMVLGH